MSLHEFINNQITNLIVKQKIKPSEIYKSFYFRKNTFSLLLLFFKLLAFFQLELIYLGLFFDKGPFLPVINNRSAS